jgi:hypothetical protein
MRNKIGKVAISVLLWMALIGLSRPAEAAAVRYDWISSTTNSQCAPGALCPILAIPGTTVNFCTGAGLGLVNTAGTVVTLVSGPNFTAASGPIQINGATFTISTLVSSSILVLTASARRVPFCASNHIYRLGGWHVMPEYCATNAGTRRRVYSS